MLRNNSAYAVQSYKQLNIALLLFAPLLIGLCMFRIYCGLEWLDLVPISRIYATMFFILAAHVLYVTYIYHHVRRKEY